jgi:hypothetical protein
LAARPDCCREYPFFISFFEGNLPVLLIAAIPMSETKSVTKKNKKRK